MRQFAHTLRIDAPPAAVLDAFFDAAALATWWRAARSFCTPQPLGSYIVEWPTSEWSDETLGRLGGALRGTVIDFREGREFFVAEAYWVPPDGAPIGPMALEVRCTVEGARTVLHVRQSGWRDTRRWTRYYDLLQSSLPVSLEQLKTYVEARAST